MSNYNGSIRDSLELYENGSSDENISPNIEEVFRGFQKVPLVICQRYDIKPYLNNMLGLNLPPDLESNTIKVTSITPETMYRYNNCSVLLKRDNLELMKEQFKQNNELKNCNSENKIQKRVSFSDKIIIHEVKEYHRCRKCPKIFDNYNTLRTHMKQFHKKRRCYICYYCKKDFLDRTFFKVHIKLHCNNCGLLFTNKKSLLEHRRTVCRIIRKYECKTCQVSLFSYIDLKDHSHEHLGTFFICDICKDRFENKCLLAHHIQFHHSESRPRSLFIKRTIDIDSVYMCKFCDQSFLDRELIEKHVSVLVDSKNFIVTDCKESYVCDQCLEKFTTETDMLQHKWTHFLKTSEKPVNEIQPSSTTMRTVYNVNEKLPLFLQPNLILEKLELPDPLEALPDVVQTPVNFVDVTNVDLNGLKKPIIDPVRKKTILSKHQCEKCGKYLSTNYCLIRHMQVIHGPRNEEDLRCKVCEETFSSIPLLRSHNCIRMNIPSMPFNDVRAETYFGNMFDVHQNGFDDITIDDSDDYNMNSVDFEIPAPIVELTEYDNLNIVVNGGNGQLNVVDKSKENTLNNLQYVVVMQEVPIEF